MRLYFMLLFLSSGMVIAGTNNLPVEHAGTIQLQHVNKFQQALAGDMVPRNTSGNVTDLGANLGTAAYRWSIINGQQLSLIQNSAGGAVSFKAPASVPLAYTLTFPSALPASTAFEKVDSSGNVSFIPSAATEQKSASSGSFSTASATFVDVTNLSVTITTGGNRVHIGLMGSTGGAYPQGLLGTTGTSSVFKFVRVTGGTPSDISLSELGGTSYPPSVLSAIDHPAAGTYTYKVQMKSTTGTPVCNEAILYAYEEN